MSRKGELQDMCDYSRDYLLDKRVHIFQPLDGYRASTDAVLLSSLIGSVKKGDTILDVGSGTGAVSLCLAHRLQNEDVKITGLEIQPRLVELSNLSAQANGFENFLTYLNRDIRTKPEEIDNCSFAHVITNPPYAQDDMPSPNAGKALAHNHHNFSLAGWIDFCIKMIRPKGYFYMINRAEAIDEILYNIHGRLGGIKVIPLFSKTGQKAKRVMIIARKNDKTPAEILNGLTVHDKQGAYTPQAHAILREGKPFF